jgi:hypothetical protein
MRSNDIDSPPTPCPNCGAERLGAYCHGCGQKFLSAEDRGLRALLKAFFQELSSLDGRLWRSLLGLFKPGYLTREYLDGRRARLYSPLALFLLINVAYFFAPTLTDFDLPFSDHVRMSNFSEPPPAVREDGPQAHSALTGRWVARELAALKREKPDATIDDLAKRYDAKSGDVSKLLILLHVPFIALAMWLLLGWRGQTYAEHVVLSLHLFTALLVMMQVVLWVFEPLARLPHAQMAWKLALPVVLLAYVGLSLRRALDLHPALAALGAMLWLFALMVVNVTVYRALQFVIVFTLS